MVFGLLIKYSASVGEKKLADCSPFITGLRQILPSIDTNSESRILNTLDALQKMIIHKFYASAQSYFRYLSLDIHNNSVSRYKPE